MFSFRLLYPKFLVILFVFLSCVPFRIEYLDYIFPSIDRMVIFYWCAYKPSLMKNGFIFSVGILKDLLLATPVGTNALSNIIVRMAFINKSENFKAAFLNLWLIFAINLGLITIIQWLLFSFVKGGWLDFKILAIQYILSVFLYPIIHRLLNMILSILPRSAVNA